MNQVENEILKLKKRLAKYQKYHLKSLAKNVSKRIRYYELELERETEALNAELRVYNAEESRRRKQQQELIKMNKIKDYTIYGINAVENHKYDNMFYEPHEKPVLGDIALLEGNEFKDTLQDLKGWFNKLPQNIKLFLVRAIAFLQILVLKCKIQVLKFKSWTNQTIVEPIKTWSIKVKNKILKKNSVDNIEIINEDEKKVDESNLNLEVDPELNEIEKLFDKIEIPDSDYLIISKYHSSKESLPKYQSKMNDCLKKYNVNIEEIKNHYTRVKNTKPGEPSGLAPGQQLEDFSYRYMGIPVPNPSKSWDAFMQQKAEINEELKMFKEFLPVPNQPNKIDKLNEIKEAMKKKLSSDPFSLQNIRNQFFNNNNNNMLFE